MLYLNIPYNEKDEAKKLFAKWDPNKKQWYATNKKDYYKFKKWISENYILCDYVYIASCEIKCWRCNNLTTVIAFAIESDNIIDLANNFKNIKDETGFDLLIYPISSDIPLSIKTIMEQNFSCKNKYSKTTNTTYFANTCQYCDALQGDFFLYEEVDSPFSPFSNKPLSLLKISLLNDIPFNLTINTVISPSVQILNRCHIIESNYKI